jgi:pyridoxine 4-dehydrogenase
MEPHFAHEQRNLLATAAGTFTMAEDLTVTRMGYGAMHLARPQHPGLPTDRDTFAAVRQMDPQPAEHDTAIELLREVVELGITHIDTADFYGYGSFLTNQMIKEALHPYPDSLHIITKVGAVRDATGVRFPAYSPKQLRQAVFDNLRHLGLDTLDVVNLRVGGIDRPTPGSIAEPFTALAQLQQEGLIKHLGLSTVNADQIAEAQSIAPIVCVQNFYNLAHREDDDLIDTLAAQCIAYVPYFPIGGLSSLQSDKLSAIATRLEASPLAVALAWLLQRSPNILLIPGTSSIVHLRDNVAGGMLALSEDDLAELNSMAS